jgi:hypothetical protein
MDFVWIGIDSAHRHLVVASHSVSAPHSGWINQDFAVCSCRQVLWLDFLVYPGLDNDNPDELIKTVTRKDH